MEIYEKNIQILVSCIAKGCKSFTSHAVGVEIEHFILNNNNDCVPYISGVEKIIEQLSPHFKNHVYSEGFLIGLSNDNYHITLEPGAQIEISIRPTENIYEIQQIYDDFLSLINPILEKNSYHLMTHGYLPKNKPEEIKLIPKKRYEFMNKYFKTTGTKGLNMMRGTASTQVSIDFKDEKDCIDKFRIANILSPIFALICDNAPVFDGKPYAGNTLRTYIWNNVDNNRCKIMPNVLDNDFSFRKYAEYIYNNPAILVIDDDDVKFTNDTKICDIYSDKLITEQDAEHLLSMFFPDVRLKQYIEIRPADSMPIEYVMAYATLIKGLFASNEKFNFNITVNDIEKAKEQIILKGFDADIYGMKAYELAKKIYTASYNSLNEKDRTYLLPLNEIINHKQTLKERF